MSFSQENKKSLGFGGGGGGGGVPSDVLKVS